MSYARLIKDVFSRQRQCISEQRFLDKIPILLKQETRPHGGFWTAERHAELLRMHYGLGNTPPQPRSTIAEHFGRSPQTITSVRSEILRLLGRATIMLEWVKDLSAEDKKHARNLLRNRACNGWKHVLTELCPNCFAHTHGPVGYVAWHEWAENMQKTHRQRRCPGCGLFAIWTPRRDDEPLHADDFSEYDLDKKGDERGKERGRGPGEIL